MVYDDWKLLYTTPKGVEFRLRPDTGSVFRINPKKGSLRFYCKGDEWKEYASRLGLRVTGKLVRKGKKK